MSFYGNSNKVAQAYPQMDKAQSSQHSSTRALPFDISRGNGCFMLFA